MNGKRHWHRYCSHVEISVQCIQWIINIESVSMYSVHIDGNLAVGLSSFYFMNWIESARNTHSHMTLIHEPHSSSILHMLRTRMPERDECIAHFMLTGTVLSSIFDSSLFLLLQSLVVSYFIYWGILLHTILCDRQCECYSNTIVKNKANTISPQREKVSVIFFLYLSIQNFHSNRSMNANGFTIRQFGHWKILLSFYFDLIFSCAKQTRSSRRFVWETEQAIRVNDKDRYGRE